jgi:hypothetical protein
MPTSAKGIENTNDRRNELIKILFGKLWRRWTSRVFASCFRQFRSTTIFRVENRQDGGISLAVVGDSYRTVISGKDTGGAYAVIDMLIPPGGGPGPHAHSGFGETFHVLDGEIELKTELGNHSRPGGLFCGDWEPGAVWRVCSACSDDTGAAKEIARYC